MELFEFENYKHFVLETLKTRPKGGYGEYVKIAKALNIHTTMVTHIFRGDHHLSTEQALKLCEYFNLNELETDYFVALVLSERAGDQRAKNFYGKKLIEIRERSLAINKRFEIKNELSESDRALFYSSWVYSAIRLLTAVPHGQTLLMLSEALQIQARVVKQTLEFLNSRGLIEKTGDRYFYRNMATYVGRESPMASRHNLNWRLRVIENLDKMSAQDIAFTSPVMIAEADFDKVSQMIVRFINNFRKTTAPSPSEILCAFNLDWVQLTSKMT